jgi:hypothetical protein
MSADGAEHMDAVDLLLKIGLFGCFVVFAICMWFIRRERDKRKATRNQDAIPPKISDG